MAESETLGVEWVDPDTLARVVTEALNKVLIIDSRSFLEYNTCHVMHSVNVVSSKIVKRRLQQDKISVKDFLINTCRVEAETSFEVIVYDQGTNSICELSPDCFVHILLSKLCGAFKVVSLLRGGFLEFQAAYPSLCEDETRKCPSLTSLSQPCLSANNIGPTRILPFLYLGSQNDATNRELLKDHDITYELNVSTNCPKPDFIMDHQFMRIPVNDNYSEKLLPHFNKAFHFLDKVRQANGCVLVHCLAGISRSPTIAIAYVMRHLRVSSEEAYRYVKSKRASISPNFNFLGQLLEYEKQLQAEMVKEGAAAGGSSGGLTAASFINGHNKRQCLTDVRSSNKLTLDLPGANASSASSASPKLSAGDLSPTSGLARLNFGEDANVVDQSSSSTSTSRVQEEKDGAPSAQLSFISNFELSVTSNHRDKRCVSELFLRKASSFKELINENNPLQELSPFAWDDRDNNSQSISSPNENFDMSDERSFSVSSSSADSGYEMMIDEKKVRLRRPLFPAKTNRANLGKQEEDRKKEPAAAERNSADSISKINVIKSTSTRSASSRVLTSKSDILSSFKLVQRHDAEKLKNANGDVNKNSGRKVKEDGLYRAQSCPGILNAFCHSTSAAASTTSTTEFAVGPLVVAAAALTSAGSLRRKLKRNVEPCFGGGARVGVEKVVNWNRYSWGNLDFGKLERLLNSDSCPDFGRITTPDTSPRRAKDVPCVIKVS